MKSQNRWTPFVSLIIVVCLLALPMTAFGRKGRDHFNRGLKYEQAQQWEKAAQEFILAVAADPSNADFQLHYRRAMFNASQMFMQQGRALAEQRDYVGAYNAYRQAFGYDPVNQLAVSEMERMLRLQDVKQGAVRSPDGTPSTDGTGGTPAASSNVKPVEDVPSPRTEQLRVVNYNGDLKHYIRTLAEQLGLNVIFDKQSFAQPRTLEINLTQPTTTAKALDFIFLQEGLFFQKLDRHTILVAEQARRPQYQQLVVRTFYLSNAKPAKALEVITKALPASVGRPQSIVVVDEDTNSLTVRDTAENVKLIGELITSIDKDRAEVVMDVNIYEVSRTDLLQLGNQIGQGAFNMGGSPGLAILSNNGVATPQQQGVNLGSIVGTTPTGYAAALIIPSMVLTAFHAKTNARLLASTQVHAFNNEESTARIGQRVPVQTAQAYPFGVQTGTAPTPGGFPTGGFPVINYEPTGLTLSFTPQVFPNYDVQVKMKIESKDVSGASTLTPTFTERTISGTARVQNNRTMMLASVSTNIESNGRQGLPFLGGLPYIGRFFTSPTRDNRQVDIVIAVTPRVLRAPAITPRDEEMRPSGTLQSPTTGSLEAMLRDGEREEQQIAAARAAQTARNAPKTPSAPLPEPTTYAPAANTAEKTAVATDQTAPVVNVLEIKDTASPGVQPTVQTAAKDNATQADTSMPQPKAASLTPQSDANAKTLDVATAIKNVVTPSTAVSTTSDKGNKEATVTTPVEDLAPKSPVIDVPPAKEPATSVIELRLSPDKSELTVGEKRQLAIEVNSQARLGLAVVMLRFDPNVLKVNSVSAGKMFIDAKTLPTITHSLDQKGVLLVSIAPAAGSQISGEGALVNVEVEAIGAGDSAVAFDLSNVHLVSADGQSTVLQLAPMSLTVKPATPAAISKPASEGAALTPVVTPATGLPNVAAAVEAAVSAGIATAPAASKSYVVQRKDNLWKIATAHGVTVASLRQANPKLRSAVVAVGSELVIP